jgi:hypothetical protein
MPPVLRGTVKFIDYAPQIHISRGNGRGLALIMEEDSFRKLTPEEIAEKQSSQKQKSGVIFL